MLEKVAKVRALREAFVEDLAGMYDADEMPTVEHAESKTEVQEEPILQTEPVEVVKEAEFTEKEEVKEASFDEL